MYFKTILVSAVLVLSVSAQLTTDEHLNALQPLLPQIQTTVTELIKVGSTINQMIVGLQNVKQSISDPATVATIDGFISVLQTALNRGTKGLLGIQNAVKDQNVAAIPQIVGDLTAATNALNAGAEALKTTPESQLYSIYAANGNLRNLLGKLLGGLGVIIGNGQGITNVISGVSGVAELMAAGNILAGHAQSLAPLVG